VGFIVWLVTLAGLLLLVMIPCVPPNGGSRRIDGSHPSSVRKALKQASLPAHKGPTGTN
jgi:hypothetical protein